MGYINIIRRLKTGVPPTYDPHSKPDKDAERAGVMRRYKIFDTPSEEIFSAYTELAARSLRTPIALMSFVDDDHVFYKETYGVNRTGELVHRKNSPCSVAIMSKEVTQFRYALSDPCVLADEKTLAEAGYKFYAGAPMITPDGYSIGILAVVDKEPRVYSPEEMDLLKKLSEEVMNEIEFRLELLKNPDVQILNGRLQKIRSKLDAFRA